MESRQDSLWYGTRRYTRSVSNQEKEAKEKVYNLVVGWIFSLKSVKIEQLTRIQASFIT